MTKHIKIFLEQLKELFLNSGLRKDIQQFAEHSLMNKDSCKILLQ